MAMPERSFDSPKYRYGFNGKEKDESGEWGDLTHYDYGFRIYNPGIARFLSVDPLFQSYPWYTPYQFAGNKPITSIDLDGLEELDKANGRGPLKVVTKSKGAKVIVHPATKKITKNVGAKWVAKQIGKRAIPGVGAIITVGEIIHYSLQPMCPGCEEIPGIEQPYTEPIDGTFVDFQFELLELDVHGNPLDPNFSLESDKDLRRERRENDPHQVYEIFGTDPETNEVVTLKFGTNNKLRNPNRARSQINGAFGFAKIYADAQHPLNVLKIKLDNIDFNVVHDELPGDPAARAAEKLEVTKFFGENGYVPPHQGLPNPDLDLLNNL